MRLRERRRHADEPAHGDPHEVRLRDAEGVQESEEIVRHLIERVGSHRDLGVAVAAHVVPEHAVLPREGPHVVVPQSERNAQRMRQRDDGRTGAALEAVVGLHDGSGPMGGSAA
jgi:hypothetical protein